jgi:hypothetical protein
VTSVAQLAATSGVLTALLAALLILGTHVVVGDANPRYRLLWVAVLTTLLVGALGAGLLALGLNSLG